MSFMAVCYQIFQKSYLIKLSCQRFLITFKLCTSFFLCHLGKSRYWSRWTKGGAGKKKKIIKYVITIVELEVYPKNHSNTFAVIVSVLGQFLNVISCCVQ